MASFMVFTDLDMRPVYLEISKISAVLPNGNMLDSAIIRVDGMDQKVRSSTKEVMRLLHEALNSSKERG